MLGNGLIGTTSRDTAIVVVKFSFSDNSFELANVNKAPHIKSVAGNSVALKVFLELFEIIKAKYTRATGATIEPLLDNYWTTRQNGFDLANALIGQNLSSIDSPVVGLVAVRDTWHAKSVA